MEGSANPINDYSFLLEEEVRQQFANVNFLLLSGKHIDARFYNAFTVLQNFESQWQYFYERLYQLQLVPDIFDGTRCYYLDFSESNKGKLTENSRHIELTELQTLVGLTLLDMYYQKYFDGTMLITWNDIRIQILESEHQREYKRILFNDVRDSYDEGEWNDVASKFTKAIDSFNKLGWVEKQSGKGEELLFEIRPAIYRLAKLYQDELFNFEEFSRQLKNEPA